MDTLIKLYLKLEEFIMKLINKKVDVTYTVELTEAEVNEIKAIVDEKVANGDVSAVQLQADINAVLQQ